MATQEKKINSSQSSGLNIELTRKLKKFYSTAREKMKGFMEECVDYVDAFKAVASNYIENYPGKAQVDAKLDHWIQTIASKLNLPTKEEAEKLSTSIDLLHHKVEALLKK